MKFWTVCLLICQVAIAGAQSGPSATQLAGFTGLYEIQEGRRVVISARTVGQQRILLMTDLGNNNIRALFPSGQDGLVAGPELLKPQPVEYKISFAQKKIKIEREGQQESGEKRNFRKIPVAFSNGDVALKGDLYLPNGTAPFGAVILVAGSEEDADRNTFDALPFVLADEGLAVFTYDKRGTGESTGSWQDSGLEELAKDVLAGLDVLLQREDIQKNNIGLIGFSEGGWVAPLAASQTDRIAYIVNLSGGAFTKGHSFLHKYRVRFLEQGLQDAELKKAMAEKEAIVTASRDRVASGSNPSGFDRRITYDPTEHWKRFRKPVLYLVGECDSLEPASESAARFQKIFSDSQHPDFAIHVIPRAHHSMFLANTCKPSESERFPGIGKFAPGYWDLLLQWIRAHALPIRR